MSGGHAEIDAVVMRLVGARPTSVRPARASGNSRVYRVEARGAVYALKRYPDAQPGDPRDRSGTERRALEYMHARGVACIPRWLGGESGAGLLEWIDGEPTLSPDAEDAHAAIDFVAAVSALSRDPEARAMPLASEACLSGDEIIRQVHARLARLRTVASTEPALERFINTVLSPELARREQTARDTYAGAGLDFSDLLHQDKRRLIPADFGFHNALRTAGPRLVFLDFEYFGWDDPAKLSADLLLHPGAPLHEEIRVMLAAGMRECFGSDPEFGVRLDALWPCFGLRWALIVLNPFLPEHARSRRMAWTDATRLRQLEIAEDLLRRSARADAT